MEVPDVQFAKSGDVNIAYQRYGTGPDVVVVPPLVTNIEIMWENELWRRVLEFQGHTSGRSTSTSAAWDCRIASTSLRRSSSAWETSSPSWTRRTSLALA